MKALYVLRFWLLLAPFLITLHAQNPLYIPDTLSGSFISLQLQQGQTNWFQGVSTQTMGANGPLLGPTLMLRKHQAITMQVSNQLLDSTTIHWHGMHVAPQHDGGPHTPIPPGTTWSPSFQVLDHAATLWYHPHLHYKTYDHVQMGIAGFIYVKDSLEATLSLPRTYGVDDIPLAIQTKGIDANFQIRTDHTALDTFLVVNGTYKPYVQLPAQWVRLRLLNASPERVYNLGLSDNRNFSMIASDNGLLNAPVVLNRILLAPGERAEILVNLASDLGGVLYLKNYGSTIPSGRYGAAQPGMGPNQTLPDYANNPLNGTDFNILEIRVGAQNAQPVTQISSTFLTHQPWAASQASLTRNLTFTSMGGMGGGGPLAGPFLINGAHFDMNVINFMVPYNQIEIWELRNQTPIAHPFHIHNVPFYILDINGVAPAAQWRGKKDVVLVPPGNGVVRFITKFEDFYNDTLPYMYHCHMLTHEDDGMMGQFIVQSPCSLLTQQPQNIAVAQGATALFSVAAQSAVAATYQWQINQGVGFQNLQDAGQFSGTQTPTLMVANVNLQNHNQLFRCVVEDATCEVISEAARLSVDSTAMGLTEINPSLLYPNPGRDYFYFDTPVGFLHSTLEVYDLQGRCLHQSILQANPEPIDARNWPASIYIVRIVGAHGQQILKWRKI